VDFSTPEKEQRLRPLWGFPMVESKRSGMEVLRALLTPSKPMDALVIRHCRESTLVKIEIPIEMKENGALPFNKVQHWVLG